MAKGKKGNRAGSQDDFEKRKRPKLGKQQSSASKTDPKVNTRKIYVPVQAQFSSASQNEQTGALRSLSDLMSRTGHSTPATRKEGWLTVRNYIKSHRDQSAEWIGPVLGRLAGTLDDVENVVRSAGQRVLADAISIGGPAVAAPFMAAFVARLAAALCHNRKEVQLDSMKTFISLTSAQVSCTTAVASVAARSALGLLRDPSKALRAGEIALLFTCAEEALSVLTASMCEESGPQSTPPKAAECPVASLEPSSSSPLLLDGYFPFIRSRRRIPSSNGEGSDGLDEQGLEDLRRDVEKLQGQYDFKVRGRGVNTRSTSAATTN